MHSATRRSHHFLGFLCAGAALLAIAGCKSGAKTGTMVQVTEDPSAVIKNDVAPEQRLATTTVDKSRKTPGAKSPSSEILSGKSPGPKSTGPKSLARAVSETAAPNRNPTDQNAVKRAVLASGKVPGKTSPANYEQTAKETTAGRNVGKTSEATPSSRKVSGYRGRLTDLAPVSLETQRKQTPTTRASKSESETLGGLVSASLTDLADLQPPVAEAKTETARQPETQVASAASKAPAKTPGAMTSTQSPHSLDLRQSLANLPALKNIDHRIARAPLKRIGVPDTPHAPALSPSAVTAEAVQVAQQKPVAVGDLAARAEAIDSPQPTREEVRPVSHDHGDQSVSQASLSQSSPSHGLQPAVTQLSVPELFDELVERMGLPVEGETPTDRERRMIVAQHLMVLAGRPDDAASAMDGLSETDRQYLQNQLKGLWTMIDPDGHPSSGRRITEALPRFRDATRLMAAATDSLALSNLEFCTEIESYGQIKPFDGNRFASGQQVILYCEVENFGAAEKNQLFHTQLRGNYDIYDSTGTKVVSQLLPVDQQTSRNHLRDYFLAYQMNLPTQLRSGSYRLQLTIEDVVGKKYGQAEIPFEIK